jgi:uncharacterized protein (DUF58 family)
VPIREIRGKFCAFAVSPNFWLLLGLFAASAIALAITGNPLYAHLAYLWGLLLLVCRVWSAVVLRGLEVRRQARTLRAQVGQVFEERLEVVNPGRWTRLWLEVRDRSSLPHSRASRVLSLIGPRQRYRYLARTRLTSRGVFPLGPTELRSGDPFGLFPVRREFPPTATLVVYPMTVEVRAFPSPPGLLPGGEALRRRTHQITPNAAGVREYAPGDPLNRIHWPSTARRDRLIVKEFELDPLAEVWIFVDAERAVHHALPSAPTVPADEVLWQPLRAVGLPPSTEEYAVTIAASVGQYFLRRGRAVGLVCQGAGLTVLPPDRGGRQLRKMLESLALVRADGDLSFAALLGVQARHLPRGSTVVLITPSTRREVALAADQMTRRGLRPVVVLLDAATFGGPSGTEELAQALRALRIPVLRVACGADLTVALSGSP